LPTRKSHSSWSETSLSSDWRVPVTDLLVLGNFYKLVVPPTKHKFVYFVERYPGPYALAVSDGPRGIAW
jgi:hypothetical protein